MSNSLIPKAIVKKLNKALPNGAQSRIAELVSKSRQHVSLVLTGQIHVTEENICIIEAAQEIAAEHKAKSKKKVKDIKKVLA